MFTLELVSATSASGSFAKIARLPRSRFPWDAKPHVELSAHYCMITVRPLCLVRM